LRSPPPTSTLFPYTTLFRSLQVGVPGRQTPTWPRIDGQSGAVGIEPAARVVEVRPILVRLPAVKPGSFELHVPREHPCGYDPERDRKSTRLNSSHVSISYAV